MTDDQTRIATGIIQVHLPGSSQDTAANALRTGDVMTRGSQARVGANKVAKGFNTSDVPMEFMLLTEEVGEAFSAWRKGSPGAGGELADVAIFLLGLTQMTGVDLEAEIEAKLAVNEARAYARLPNGTLVKRGEGS